MGAYRRMSLAAFAAMSCLVAAPVVASADVVNVPVIDSESASKITATDATLEAFINSQEAPAGDFYQFQVAANPSELASEIACPSRLVGYSGCMGTPTPGALPIGFHPSSFEHLERAVSLDLANAGVTLKPGTTYHYRVLVARRIFTEDTIDWEPPTVYGPDQTFTTPSAPMIESESVSHLTPTDATLEAQMNTDGLETTYEFYLQEAPLCLDFGCEIPEYEPLVLPGGKLLGSFVGQNVSVDLNSASVTLRPGADYRYWVTAINAAGATEGQTQRFIAPEDGVQTPNTTTSLGSQSTMGLAQNAGQGTVTPSATDPVGSVRPSPKMTALTNAQKLAKAVRACKRKPRKQRASCVKQAHRKYGTAGKTGQQASTKGRE
jgi:hypothetical protein